MNTVPATSQAIDVTVNVTTPGTYTIGTNTVNGLSFFATGYLAATGVQTVPLYAHGTPAAAGSFTYTVAYGSSLCTTNVSVAASTTTFTCAGATQTLSPNGGLTSGTAYTGTYTVPYTTGSGVNYVTTTQTVSGLTLTRVAGTYAAGGGNVVYNLAGTYTGTTDGTAVFTTPECGTVTFFGFDCAGATQTLSPTSFSTSGTVYTGSYTVPYTAGNGLSYAATAQTVNGLTLTRTAGTYAAGGGNVVYDLTGTYTGGSPTTFTTSECGTVTFAVDAIRGALTSAGCASCAAYDAAVVNDWVSITAAEYNVVASLSGMAPYGATPSQMTTNTSSANTANNTATQNFTTQSGLPASNYPVALSVRTSSGGATSTSTMAGLKLKVSSTSQTAGYADLPVGRSTPNGGNVTVNTTFYFVLKQPTTRTAAVASNLAIYMPQTWQVGAISAGGTHYHASGDSASPNISGAITYFFQVLATPTKQW